MWNRWESLWDSLREWLRVLRRPGREREVVVQSVKAALAAVGALVVTAPRAGKRRLPGAVRRADGHQSGAPLVDGAFAAAAPARGPRRRIVARVVPVGAVAVPLAVLLGLLVGRWRQFGPDGWWVAITALIVVVNGAAADPLDLASWVALSLCGSVIGAS